MSNTNKLPEARLLITLQIVCAASAIASLPRPGIDPLWLLAFILPSALFLFLGSGTRKAYMPIWLRISIVALAQSAAAYLAYHYLGPLDHQNSLACSLLPALTYFTLRREPSDTSLSLFLSFCFLLIGIMLNNNAADWTLIVFLAACGWAMQIEASNRALMIRHAARGRVMSAGARFLRRSQVGAALMMVALLVYQGIALIPSPTRTTTRTSIESGGTHGGRMIGLSSRFDLSGNEGRPLNLTASQVISVRAPTGSRLPSDLYLRMTYFDYAYDNQEWKTQISSYVTRPIQPTGLYVHKAMRPRSRFPMYRMTVTRIEPASENEIFLPPGSVQITGLRLLQYSLTDGYFRSPDPTEMGYGVRYQRPHKRRGLGSIDPFLDSNAPRLTRLPPGLRTPELIDLAHEWAGRLTRRSLPMAVARKIAGKLQSRCRYVLREPSGPYDDPLHNFLFGQREGYCMHFATALAVMLRINKIPCRIGVGFHGGKTMKDGARVFGSEHAHAWVELPLKNTGWTLVDPTPPADRTRRGWPDPRLVDRSGTGDDDSGMLSGSCLLAGLRDPLANLGAFLTLAFVLLGLTIGLIVLATRRSRQALPRASQERPTPDAVRARRMLDQILRVLAKCGHPKHQRSTLEQYHGYLLGEKSLDHAVLAGAFRAYQDVRFGAKNLDDDREESLAAGIAVTRGMKST